MIKIEMDAELGKIKIEEKYRNNEERLATFKTMIRAYYDSVKQKGEEEYAEFFKENLSRLFDEDLIFNDEKLKQANKDMLKQMLNSLLGDLLTGDLKSKLEELKKEAEKKSKSRAKKSKKD